MPVSKAIVTGAKIPKLKSLKVVEVIRDGSFYWQTEGKVPATMQTAQGWVADADGVFEVERPKSTELAAFGRDIEGFGFKVKRIEQQQVVASPSLGVLEKSEGEVKLATYLDKKDKAARAKEASEGARDVLKDWMVANGAPKDPAHPDARIAQIGSHKVHSSWVNGRQTAWDDRDHKPVSDWAIEEGCADEMVQVIIHRTIPYDEYEVCGIPEGFEGSVTIDPDVYEYHTRIGAVPQDIHETFENRGAGYYGIKVYDTKELACTNCGAAVKKTQKFCGECGNKQ